MERGLSQEEDREEGDRRRERREERDDGRGGHRGHYSSPGGPGGSLASLLTKPDVLAAVTMIGQLSQGGGFGQVTDSSRLVRGIRQQQTLLWHRTVVDSS